jgi:pimeloyl-ACP methyl ester carboxylesterase/ketosteroid isomerase-like protein
MNACRRFGSRAMALVIGLLATTSALAGRTFETMELADGRTLHYAIVTPDGFDASVPHPVLLALPLGRQNQRMVESTLDRYWEAEAMARGWAIVSPVAPAGRFFYRGSEAVIPELLDHIASQWSVEGGRFHVAGPGNGGRSAFRVALDHPERFASLIALPGYPESDEDRERLGALKDIPVLMLAGGRDATWVEHMTETRDALRALGGTVTLRVFEDEGHVPPSITETLLFDWLDDVRHGSADPATPAAAPVRPTPTVAKPEPTPTVTPPVVTPEPVVAIADTPDAVLDDFHDAAAKADFDRYFGHFAPDAVFIGTDASERWTLDEFRAFARPYFDRGQGWTYVKKSRHVAISRDGGVAWFDEITENAKLGTCRGSGVLVRIDDAWRIAQYHLTVPIPNDLAALFAEMIREHASNPDGSEP